MRTILKCTFAAIFITSVSDLHGAPRPATGETNQVGAASQTSPNLARMEEIVQSYVSEKKFMGCVLLARGSNVLLDKGYGFANLEWEIPNSPSAKFRLGSVTKQFTAASILLLQERGKLKVTDPVKKYVQDAPGAWDKITIFNLLTHTSGIPNFTSFPDYESQEPFATTPEKLVTRFRDKPLDFQPGEKMSYSNSGYVLLGYLIEKISGQDYEKFVQENIFTPLAMKDSGYDSNSAIIQHRAAGYVAGPTGPTNAGFIHMTVPLSAGALYSTTEDLLRWEQGLFGGKLLSPSSLREMTTPFKNDYAFGVQVHTVHGRKVIDHGGGIEGFNTTLAYYPDDKLTVIVLGNLNGSAPQEIASKLAAVIHGEKVVMPSERKEVPVDPKLFNGYVGRYELAPNFIFTITQEDDHLFAQATGQAKLQIYPESDHDYFLKVVDAQITFVTDSNGRATELILHQGGMDQHAKRMEGELPPAKEHKEVTLDPKVFNGYAGRYQLAPSFIMTVTREGDHLFMQATGQPKVQIYPESDRDYFLKVVDAQITFVTDSNGRATELILHQGGVDQHAKRMEGELPPAKEHKEVTVDPKVFNSYVGRYQLAPSFIMTITREGDHLFMQGTGQPKAQIYPESDRDYFLKVVDAQITFGTDSNGRATELILHQGGMDQHAKRIE